MTGPSDHGDGVASSPKAARNVGRRIAYHAREKRNLFRCKPMRGSRDADARKDGIRVIGDGSAHASSALSVLLLVHRETAYPNLCEICQPDVHIGEGISGMPRKPMLGDECLKI